jgi:hypothetical protein
MNFRSPRWVDDQVFCREKDVERNGWRREMQNKLFREGFEAGPKAIKNLEKATTRKKAFFAS